MALDLTGARFPKSFLYGVSASDPITFTFIASSPAKSPPAAST